MEKNVVNNFGSFELVFEKGTGSTLYSVEGKKYIDFVSGIGVNCLGHNHSALVDAITEQATKQIHISNYYFSDIGLKYAENLLNATGFEKAYFGNSGAEANEAAIKLARKYGYMVSEGLMPSVNGKQEKSNTKRNVIVTLEKSFHGRTIATLSATGQDKFHPECFAPYPEGFKTIKANDYASLENAFDDSVCALLLECVQGEGGVNLIDKEWANAAAKMARKAGAVVIADEVQTGMSRTGTLLASEDLGFMPEAVTLAKGIAGGIPMGACLYRGVLKDVFVAGDHQSTFAGNPIACSAANCVLGILNNSEFKENVKSMGNYIMNTVKNWNLPCIKEVRGKGLMIGIDIEETESFQTAAQVQKLCLEEAPVGLCITTAGPKTLRFLPPLVITQQEVDTGLSILKRVLEKN